VVHDIPRLIQFRGGNIKFIQSLDDHFNDGHNDHTNEVRFPSHAPINLPSLSLYHAHSSFVGLMLIFDHIIAVASYSLPVFPCWSGL
jgi:hypothetical protein